MPFSLLLLAGFLLFVGTGLYNPGLIAMDDYFMLVANAIPSQNLTAGQVIATADIRSPLPSLVAFSMARVALRLGIMAPIDQLRFVLAILGGFSFIGFAMAVRVLYAKAELRRAALFLVAFYFLSPLLFSRVMVETLAAPFLLASAAFATRYRSTGDLLASAALLAIAAVFRPQAGVCFVALLWIAKRPGDLTRLVGFGVLLFVLTGLPDLVLRGAFHQSLSSYLSYNLHHSSSYGTSPFYTPFLVLAAVTLPPFSISRFRGFPWRQEYFPLRPALYFLGVFVLAHAIVPHKEERFLIPILPLFLALLAPAALFLARFRWRRMGWLTLNGFLLVLAMTNTPQRNVLDLVAFLDRTPAIRKVVGIEDTLVLYPDAFLTRKLETALVKKEQDVEALCGTVVIVRKDLESTTPLTQRWSKIREFSPDLLERAVVFLNPGPNRRRGPLSVFAPKECASAYSVSSEPKWKVWMSSSLVPAGSVVSSLRIPLSRP